MNDPIRIIKSPGFKKFEINLNVNVGDEGARIMRVGEGFGASKCILNVTSAKEVDSIIDRLLEIRKELQ